MRNQNRITPAQARQLMQQRAMLWDVRTPAEYAAGHIPSARNYHTTASSAAAAANRSCRTCRPTATRSLSAAAAGSAAP